MKHLKNFSIKRERKEWVAAVAKRELGDLYDKLQQMIGSQYVRWNRDNIKNKRPEIIEFLEQEGNNPEGYYDALITSIVVKSILTDFNGTTMSDNKYFNYTIRGELSRAHNWNYTTFTNLDEERYEYAQGFSDGISSETTRSLYLRALNVIRNGYNFAGNRIQRYRNLDESYSLTYYDFRFIPNLYERPQDAVGKIHIGEQVIWYDYDYARSQGPQRNADRNYSIITSFEGSNGFPILGNQDIVLSINEFLRSPGSRGERIDLDQSGLDAAEKEHILFDGIPYNELNDYLLNSGVPRSVALAQHISDHYNSAVIEYSLHSAWDFFGEVVPYVSFVHYSEVSPLNGQEVQDQLNYRSNIPTDGRSA